MAKISDLTATITGVTHADMKKERRKERQKEGEIQTKKQEISVGC
jgi:hypothetical protein